MLKQMLNSAGPIGIDLCDDAVRLLQLGYVQGALRVIASARISVGETSDPYDPSAPAHDQVVRAIGERVKAGGFSGRRCAIALPESCLAVRTARLPVMPDNELGDAVRLDAPVHLGLADVEGGAEIGWLRTGEIFQGDDHRYELMYFGAATKRLEQLAYAYEGVGLEPVAIEPRFVTTTRAGTRYLRRAADSGTVQLLIDVNRLHSTVIITRGPELVFTKSFPIGTGAMADAIGKKLGLDPATLSDMRRQRMDARSCDVTDQRIERAMFDAVRPTLAGIAHEASLCLRHYSVTFRGVRPSRIVLAGPGAMEPGLDTVVADTLGIEVYHADPFDGVRTDTVVGGGSYGPGWTSAMGVAVRDLLKRTPSRKRNRRRSRSAHRGQTPSVSPESRGEAA
ncbi:MAG: hypothetical protein Tsb0013_02720 [Phycisphaerales bacterium]